MSIKVDIFSSPGCGKCGHAKIVLENIAKAMGGNKIEWRDVNILDEMDYAIDIGVLSTPSIAINGVLIFTSLPSEKKLRAELEKQLRLDEG